MSLLSVSEMAALRDARGAVLDRIAAAAMRKGREPSAVTLVAVTKSTSIDHILALLTLGQCDLGENRVQQLEERCRSLDAAGAAARWHMIGHLQRNKVRQVVPLVELIHSVDSLRLAEEINTCAGRRAAALPNASPMDVLLQVNIAEEEQKFGLSVADAPVLAGQVAEMPHLRLRGLMTMAPYGDDREESRPVFARAGELFAALRSQLKQDTFDTLSMGMTNDFEVAVEEGATLVRVGRALFGD
jgi:pyridoxal phosphate enzyme (YggS family)